MVRGNITPNYLKPRALFPSDSGNLEGESDNLEEEEVAKKMGYKTTEKNRQPGYKQIKNIKKSILIKVKKEIDKSGADIF